jgi:hypothetical protein
MVRGHERLGVAFSPCPEVVVEVKPADYPTGRPMRLAYLGADGSFRVVEATTGEKGPFRTLATGPLRRGEPLGVTLYDGETPAAKIVLEDWSAQAATQLSPTAGWGLPVNAIEFVREGDAPGSLAVFYVTLAGTSVGRGWDSVGHGEGMYRNRIRIEPASGEVAAGSGSPPVDRLDLPRSIGQNLQTMEGRTSRRQRGRHGLNIRACDMCAIHCKLVRLAKEGVISSMRDDQRKLLMNLLQLHSEGVTLRHAFRNPKRMVVWLVWGLGFSLLLLSITEYSPPAYTYLGFILGIIARDFRNLIVLRRQWPVWDSIIEWNRVSTKMDEKEVDLDRFGLD